MFQPATCTISFTRGYKSFFSKFFWVNPEATPKALVPRFFYGWVVGSFYMGQLSQGRSDGWPAGHDLLQQMLQIVMGKIRDTVVFQYFLTHWSERFEVALSFLLDIFPARYLSSSRNPSISVVHTFAHASIITKNQPQITSFCEEPKKNENPVIVLGFPARGVNFCLNLPGRGFEAEAWDGEGWDGPRFS